MRHELGTQGLPRLLGQEGDNEDTHVCRSQEWGTEQGRAELASANPAMGLASSPLSLRAVLASALTRC